MYNYCFERLYNTIYEQQLVLSFVKEWFRSIRTLEVKVGVGGELTVGWKARGRCALSELV